MANNSIQVNATEIGCDINWDIFLSYWLLSSVVCSVASFAGNVLVILIVYKTKTLRTTTNYFIVNMAISDVFVPALDTLRITLLYRKDAPNTNFLYHIVQNASLPYEPFLWGVNDKPCCYYSSPILCRSIPIESQTRTSNNGRRARIVLLLLRNKLLV